MTAEILDFTGVTKGAIDPDKVIQGALGRGLVEVIILGLDVDGEFYFAFSEGQKDKILWLLESCKFALMQEA